MPWSHILMWISTVVILYWLSIRVRSLLWPVSPRPTAFQCNKNYCICLTGPHSEVIWDGIVPLTCLHTDMFCVCDSLFVSTFLQHACEQVSSSCHSCARHSNLCITNMALIRRKASINLSIRTLVLDNVIGSQLFMFFGKLGFSKNRYSLTIQFVVYIGVRYWCVAYWRFIRLLWGDSLFSNLRSLPLCGTVYI